MLWTAKLELLLATIYKKNEGEPWWVARPRGGIFLCADFSAGVDANVEHFF